MKQNILGTLLILIMLIGCLLATHSRATEQHPGAASDVTAASVDGVTAAAAAEAETVLAAESTAILDAIAFSRALESADPELVQPSSAGGGGGGLLQMLFGGSLLFALLGWIRQIIMTSRWRKQVRQWGGILYEGCEATQEGLRWLESGSKADWDSAVKEAKDVRVAWKNRRA